MGAIAVEDRPTGVEPTETKARKQRSDKGQPRKPRDPNAPRKQRVALTPGQLRARADELEREAADRAIAKCAELCIKARGFLDKAIETGAPKAEELRQWVELMPVILP